MGKQATTTATMLCFTPRPTFPTMALVRSHVKSLKLLLPNRMSLKLKLQQPNTMR